MRTTAKRLQAIEEGLKLTDPDQVGQLTVSTPGAWPPDQRARFADARAREDVVTQDAVIEAMTGQRRRHQAGCLTIIRPHLPAAEVPDAR